jgi:two-component system, OmpR family, sensor histidine kinase VicK
MYERRMTLQGEIMQILPDSKTILKIYKEKLKSASRDINLIYPTINAYYRHRNSGIFEILRNLAKDSNVKVRVLLPWVRFDKKYDTEIRAHFGNLIEFKILDKKAESTATVVVIDKKLALIMELKDDTKDSIEEAIAYALLTTSKHITLSYISMFNTLWHQSELNEFIAIQNLELKLKNEELIQHQTELQESFQYLAEVNKELNAANLKIEAHDKVQTEFINVAAHELRTPTQAIIGYCEMMDMLPERSKEYITRLKRNAERLYTLTSDILDATKIEMGTLTMKKSDFNLTETINEVIKDMRKKAYILHKESGAVDNLVPNIRFSEKRPFFIHADKHRIIQVLSNLLDNAIKFSEGEVISITLLRNNSKNELNIAVEDRGRGIDPEIYPLLFEKFTTKSIRGTGLGLFIAKKIVQAHGGKILGMNNKNSQGATFLFSLPLFDDLVH